MQGIFIAWYVAVSFVLGAFGRGGWWALPLIALPGLALPFVPWLASWPKEYSRRTIRIYQAISVTFCLLFTVSVFLFAGR